MLSKTLEHYLGVCLVLVALYFFVLTPILHHLDVVHSTAPVTRVVSPEGRAASHVTTRTIQVVADASRDKAIEAALQDKIVQLSASQQTVARVIERLGVNGRMASAAAEGLTRGAPKQQVVEVATGTKVIPPPPALSDDQIQRDLKSVLQHTKVQTMTNVNVKWEDKPPSPIFATYVTDGSAGVGYTLKREPAWNLDGLVTLTPSSMETGLGIEHPIKGTGAGIGVNAGIDVHSRRTKIGVFVSIHS